MEGFVQLADVTKRYRMGEVTVSALEGVSFTLGRGEYVILLGPSGAGKSTVLNILGGIDRPTSGRVLIDGKRVDKFGRRALTLFRRNSIGYVFQFYNLIQNLNALENVELAAQNCDHPLNPVDLLHSVGLSDRLRSFPSQLSGGEQQRVAIARALVKNPALLLCDEPTGALDDASGRVVLGLLRDTCTAFGTTCVMVTHNTALAPMANRVIAIRSGRVSSETQNPYITPVEAIAW